MLKLVLSGKKGDVICRHARAHSIDRYRPKVGVSVAML